MRKFALRLIPFVAAVAIVASGLLWMQSAGASTESMKSVMACATCHSMETEVSTWLASDHKSVACLECHKETDVAWVRHEFTDRNDAMATQAKAHGIELKVPDERCIECHKPQMDAVMKDVTPRPLLASASAADAGKPMPVKAAHDLHVNGKPKLECVACHLPSAHGPKPGTDQWRDLAHQQCQTCHTQQQVTLKVTGSVGCSACHTDAKAIVPADHKDSTKWAAQHGKASNQDKTCGQCHLADSAGPHSDLAKPGSFTTTGEKDACLTCHQGMTMPHPQDFLAGHGQQFLTAKSGTCEFCHTPEKTPVKPAPAHASASYCTECHLGQTMPHPADFLASHGSEAKSKTCEACHSPKNPAKPYARHANAGYCTSCHNSYEHPTGWVANHGTRANDPSCGTCHTLTGQQGQHNACAACHTGTPGKDTWHPKMWFVSHARAVEQQGDEQCINCHAEVEPSCSACHRNR